MATAEEARPQHAASDAPAPAPAAPAPDPAAVALPTFAVGAISLALYLLGFLPAEAATSIAPVLIFTAGLGVLIAGIWAAALGQSMVAGIFVTFATFWTSLGVFLIGAAPTEFMRVPEEAATDALATFLISWLAVFVVLTLVTLRLPGAFTLLFVLVDIAVLLVLLGTLGGSTGLLQIGGIAVLAFVLVGVYLFASSASAGTGGKALPAGRPAIK